MNQALINPKAIVFDWDDTLVDNWHSIHAGLNAALTAMGHDPWPIDKTRSNVRRSMRDSFPSLFGEKWKEAAEIFLSHVRRNHLETIYVLDYVPEMLSHFHQAGIYLGVVSNKNGVLLREEVEFLNWNKWISKTVGANDAVRDKPDKAPIDLVLDGSGISRSKEVWFVGDAISDMECAYNAGVSAILLRANAYDPKEFAEFPPDQTFKNASELTRFFILRKQSGQNR